MIEPLLNLIAAIFTFKKASIKKAHNNFKNTTSLFVKLLCAFLIETFNKQKEVSDFVKITKHSFYDKKNKTQKLSLYDEANSN